MHKHHLLAAAVLAIFALLVQGTSGFAFYKLSLRWPPSVCNVGAECVRPIPGEFTIHGLWPQLANDHEVPPYDPNTNKCTTEIPTPANQILDKLRPIETQLQATWPALFDGKHTQFWETEWTRHGMCSDYPTDPYNYFDAALTLTNRYDLFQVMGIKPGKELHQVDNILDAVKKNVGAYPQIACNTLPRVKTLQLWELRFCFQRATPPDVLQDCPNKLAGTCTQLTDEVSLPEAPPIIREFASS